MAKFFDFHLLILISFLHIDERGERERERES